MAEGASKAICNEGGICEACAGDVADPDFIKFMTELAVKKIRQAGIFHCQCGHYFIGEFLAYGPEQFQRVIYVNMGGSFFLAQHAARQMKEQGHGGAILFMSSVTGHQAHKDLAAYSMTKAAVEMLAKKPGN